MTPTGTYTFADNTQVTPPPVYMEPQRSSSLVGSKAFIAILALILGVVLSGASLVGGLGNAFYVSRTEYTQQILAATTEKMTTSNTLGRIDSAVARQEAAVQKLSDTVDALRQAVSALPRSRGR